MSASRLTNVTQLSTGDPSILNVREETSLHAVCSASTSPEIRAKIMTSLINWDKNNHDKVSINQARTAFRVGFGVFLTHKLAQVDIEGNTAIHYAAKNGLLLCVEKLVALGAIISIVNKNNTTCCEMVPHLSYLPLSLPH